MRLKICGLRQTENIKSLLSLKPDYLGFIFYEKSKRHAEGVLDAKVVNFQKVDNFESKTPIKTGVFVNEDFDKIKAIVEKYGLNAVQLHGDESANFCRKLRAIIHLPTPLEGGQDSTKIKNPIVGEKKGIGKYKKRTNNLAPQKNQVVAVSPLEGGRWVNNGLQIIKVFSVNDDFDFSITKKYEPIVDLFLFDTKGKERGGNGIAFDWDILKKYNGEKPFFLSGGIGPDDASEIKKINHPKLYGVDINSQFEIEPGLKNVELVKRFFKEIKNT